MLTKLHSHFLKDAHGLVTNGDGTPNWLGVLICYAALVVLPGVLAGHLFHHWYVGVLVSAVILVLSLAALFALASALKGLS